jgi:hypothetical protein
MKGRVGAPLHLLKLSWARRILITALSPGLCRGFVRPQQLVIEFADGLDWLASVAAVGLLKQLAAS